MGEGELCEFRGGNVGFQALCLFVYLSAALPGPAVYHTSVTGAEAVEGVPFPRRQTDYYGLWDAIIFSLWSRC